MISPMKRTLGLLFAIAVTVWTVRPDAAQLPPYGGAAEFRADLAARRAKTMAALGPETILVGWSAPTRVYSTDVDYEYRQDSNLLYLTGIDQEETILVLVPGAKTKKEITVLPRVESDARALERPHADARGNDRQRAASLPSIRSRHSSRSSKGCSAAAGFQQSAEEAAAEFGTVLRRRQTEQGATRDCSSASVPAGGADAAPRRRHPPRRPSPGSQRSVGRSTCRRKSPA